MELHCPYCASPIAPPRAKPGRFVQRCANCSQKYLLTVAESLTEESLQFLVSRIEGEGRGSSPGPAASAPAAPAAIVRAVPPVPPSPPPATVAATTQLPVASVPLPTVGPPVASADAAGEVPSRLGGYRIVRLLGRGAMGAVYLAYQVSLDRLVAIKTIHRRMSQDPVFIARFTREAYAAAQLQHHNAVQIFDMGTEAGVHFFSMEYVDGQTLADVIRREGRLEPVVAAGHVLQAARALKFAHDHGMVHRDVKPGNIMVNRDGVIKVTDLGLVKVPARPEDPAHAGKTADGQPAAGALSQQVAAEVTRAGMMSGTPAYMAPEQSVDFKHVDARADIYSLGCTLYDLLTGHPPFPGTTAMEVITKHRTEAVVRPDVAVKGVPAELSAVVVKMMAKRPEDRYQSMGEVIRDLERYLGIHEPGTIVRWPEHAQRLADCAQRFAESPLIARRRKILVGVSSVAGVLAMLGAALSLPLFAGGVLGAAALAWTGYFITAGYGGRTYLFQKAREWALGAGWRDSAEALGLLVVLLLVLWAIGMLVPALVVGALAVAAGAAAYVFLDRPIAADRAAAIAEVQEMIKQLRLAGQEEAAIRRFIAQYSGDRWEEFFETLFGYEGKLEARRQWGRGDAGRERPHFRGWREPVVRWIDRRLRARREAKERGLLAQVEERRLVCEGLPADAARQRAENMAWAAVAQATELRQSASTPPVEQPVQPPTVTLPGAPPPQPKPASVLQSLVSAKPYEGILPGRGLLGWLRGAVAGMLDVVIGPGIRLLAGGLLLAGCLLWAHQNGMLRKVSREDLDQTLERLQELSGTLADSQPGDVVDKLGQLSPDASPDRTPLQLPLLPGWLAGLFNSINPGVAGLVLVLSAFSQRLRTAAIVLPAAAVILLAHTTGLPGLVPPMGNSVTSLLAGLGLSLLGVIFNRGSD